MEFSDLLKEIKNIVLRIVPKSRIILYGSRARGDFQADSDVDLLILVPDSYEGQEYVNKKFQISDGLYDLSLKTGYDLSPLVIVPKVYFARKTPFTVNIANEGIEL